MADKKDDKPLDSESENLSNKNISTKIIESITPNKDAKNMEVHHHPKLHHEHKPWKEYFLEGFMIFIAVMMGFFAENVREYLVEKHREKEYVVSMINDLKADTANIARIIQINNEYQLPNSDSLIKQLNKEKWDDATKAAIYVYKSYQGSVSTNIFSKQTLTQLKSAGGARLIKDVAALDSIMDYDANISLAEEQGKAFGDFTLKVYDVEGKIFYAKKIDNVPNGDSVSDNEKIDWYVKNGRAKDLIINNDPKDLNEYINKVKGRRGVIKNYVQILSYLNIEATNLIKFLTKEYDLD